MVHPPVLPVKKEAGFTYIEFCIVLSALIVFLPALFFVSSTTEKEIKEMIHHSRLEMDYLSFLVWLEKDVQKGVHFRETDGVLYIEQDQQVMIRYMLKDRRLIRSVKKPEDKGFQGHDHCSEPCLLCAFFTGWKRGEVGCRIAKLVCPSGISNVLFKTVTGGRPIPVSAAWLCRSPSWS
ncbi:MAG: hypothetical protein ACOX0J_13945 [Thermoactinomyces vulgaris]